MSIRRLQRALALMTDADRARPGTVAALDGGYSDHAHFIRECRALAGFTPGDALLRRSELTGIFLEGGA
jgi:AraC-like DNA-binding protein